MPSKTLHLSARAHAMPYSPIRKLVKYADEAKKRGIHVYHLNIGQPDIETPAEFFDAVHTYQEKVIAYGNSQGLAGFLDSLVNYYRRIDLKIGRENVLVTTGGSEALTFAMMAVAGPGE